MKKILFLIILGLYSFNASAMDAKSKAEADQLTPERHQELLKEAATATAKEKSDKLEWAFGMYNLPEFYFWLEHADSEAFWDAENICLYLNHEDKSNHPILRNLLSKLKILLKLGANPNKEEGGLTPLRQAIQCGKVEGAKILLADPRTVMDSKLLGAEAVRCYHGGKIWTEQQKNCSHKKMVKLLLFMGCDATLEDLSGITAASRARSHDRDDIALIIEDYQNIEKHCTPEELAEFRAVKQERIGRSFENIMRREFGGLKIKRASKKASAQTAAAPAEQIPIASTQSANSQTAAAPAAAIKFTWPSTKDSKENSK